MIVLRLGNGIQAAILKHLNGNTLLAKATLA